MPETLLAVTVLTPEKVIFEGSAQRVVLPGEQGVFEVLPFHKRLFSRLLAGTIIIDDKTFSLYRGIVHVGYNAVTILMEQACATQSG